MFSIGLRIGDVLDKNNLSIYIPTMFNPGIESGSVRYSFYIEGILQFFGGYIGNRQDLKEVLIAPILGLGGSIEIQNKYEFVLMYLTSTHESSFDEKSYGYSGNNISLEIRYKI